MGIYIFKWSVLREYLIRDDQNPESSHDFGKDIIPPLIEENRKLFAYPFKGYWKDVGTIQSLWEANMDLLDKDCELNLFDHSWRIYSVNPNQPPQYICPAGEVSESLVNEGRKIEGEVSRTVVFQGVTVKKGAVVKETVIMPDAVIGHNCVIEKAIVSPGVYVPDGTIIKPDENDKDEITLVSEETIGALQSN